MIGSKRGGQALPEENVTTKFSVDISDLKRNISEANKQIKLANAEFKAASAGMDDWQSSTDGLEAKLKQLQTTLDANNSKLSSYQEQLSRLQSAQDDNAKKADALREAYQKAVSEYGEGSAEAQKYASALDKLEASMAKNETAIDKLRVTMLNQQAAVGKNEKEIRTYSSMLDEVQSSASGASDGVKEFGDDAKKSSKNVDAAGDSTDALDSAMEGVKTAVGSASDAIDKLDGALGTVKNTVSVASEGFTVLKGVFADLVSAGIQKAAEGIGEFVNTLADLPEATQEYRDSMSRLNSAWESVGSSPEMARQAYENFYAILGESDRSVEAVGHLSQMVETQQDLADWTNIAAGVWGKFGESIPIEGLTEGSNETLRTGTVTGQLADALNWAADKGETFGVTLKENTEANKDYNEAVKNATTAEDYFNIALGECSTQQERQQLIVDTLTSLYGESAEAYKKNNEQVMEARRVTARYDDAMAALGDRVEPVMTSIKSGTADVLDAMLDLTEDVDLDRFRNSIDKAFDKFVNDILPDVAEYADKIPSKFKAWKTVMSPGMSVVVDLAKGVYDNLKKIDTGIGWDDIAGGVNSAFGWFVETAAPGVADFVNTTLTDLSKMDFSGVTDSLGGGFEWLVDDILPRAGELLTSTASGVGDLLESAAPLGEKLGSAFEVFLDTLIYIAENVDWSGIGSLINGAFGWFCDTAVPIASDFIKLLVDNSDVVLTLMAGIAAGLAAKNLATGVQEAATTFLGLKDALLSARDGQLALNSAQSANVIGLVVTAAVTLIGVLGNLKAEFDDTVHGWSETNEEIEKSVGAMEDLQAQYDNATAVMSDFSDLTTDAGETAEDLQNQMQAAQDGISQIINEAKSTRQGYRQEELDQIREFNQEYVTAQGELQQLLSEQNQAQIDVWKYLIDNTTMTDEQIQGIINSSNEKIAQLQEQNVEMEAANIAMLQQQVEAGTITQDEYDTQMQALLDRTAQANEELAGQNDQLVAQALGQQRIHLEQLDAEYQSLTDTSEKEAEYLRKHHEYLQAIYDDNTLSIQQKNDAVEQENQRYIHNLENLSRTQQVHWERFNYITDQGIAAETQAFFNWIGQTAEAGYGLTQENVDLANNILNAYDDLPEELQDQGKAALDSLAAGMEDQFPALKNASNMEMDDLLETMRGVLGTLHDRYSSSETNKDGQALANGIIDGENAKRQEVINNSGDLASQGAAAIEEQTGRYSQAGGSQGQAYGAGLADSSSTVRDGATSLQSSALYAMDEGVYKFKELGRYSGEGFGDGFKSSFQKVTENILGWFSSLGNKIANLLGIHSPSRVTIGFGKFYGQGFGVGFDGEKQSLIRTVTNVANSLTSAFSSALSNASIEPLIGDEAKNSFLSTASKLKTAVRGAAYGVSGNNATNSAGFGGKTVIVNQYNTSPKPLSRLDIYRMTRSAVASAVGGA